jgi:hypothetical protein
MPRPPVPKSFSTESICLFRRTRVHAQWFGETGDLYAIKISHIRNEGINSFCGLLDRLLRRRLQFSMSSFTTIPFDWMDFWVLHPAWSYPMTDNVLLRYHPLFMVYPDKLNTQTCRRGLTKNARSYWRELRTYTWSEYCWDANVVHALSTTPMARRSDFSGDDAKVSLRCHYIFSELRTQPVRVRNTCSRRR